MLLIHKLVCNTVLNHGVQEEPLLVFQEFLDQEHIDLDKQHLVINAEREECQLQLKYGEDGIEELISNKRDMLQLQQLLQQALSH